MVVCKIYLNFLVHSWFEPLMAKYALCMSRAAVQNNAVLYIDVCYRYNFINFVYMFCIHI